MKRGEAIEQLQNCIDLIKQDGQDYLDDRDIPLLDMAIEVLQGDMYCPNCGVRLVQEDEYLEPTQTHGRLIDADALMEYCSNQKSKTISNNDIARFPTTSSNRPHGEWIETSEGTMCGNCHKFPYDDGEYHIANWHSDFCPNCGADMRGDDN